MKINALEKDIERVLARVQFEGLAFLTKTLPKLGRALDQGLVSQRFNIPREFNSQKDGNRPAFLQVYFNLVFDEDGCLLAVASVEAVKHLRQILYFAFKLEIPFSDSQSAKVIQRFVETDENLGLQCDPLAGRLLQLAKIITGKVFHDFSHKDIRPQHGPGAVATGERLEEKWKFSRLYNAIHQVYPYYEYFAVGGALELSDRLAWYKSLYRTESGKAKVVLVPKDSRGPRLISCEPLEYQWIQQGLGRKLASFLEYRSRYTRGNINFTNQEINRSLAQSSSATKSHATLDLKDASDRVSLELVRRVFETTPQLLRALEACRTTQTVLPNGEVLDLYKYAPMGSALCFPVESYIFWLISVCAVIEATNLPLARVVKRIFVYGDDIIVPTNWASQCIHGLESVGLLVNLDKSCITGSFRESCGMDAFNGIDVTPIRLKTLWTNQSTNGSVLASYSAIANLFSQRGYGDVSNIIWAELRKVFGKIPFGIPTSPYPCRFAKSAAQAEQLNAALFRKRFNRHYQRIEFLLPSLSSRRIKSKLDGWPRLLRNMVSPPFGDPSVVVVPRSTRIKRGWMAVA